MAITDAYATAAEYRSEIHRSDSADDTEILLDLAAVSRYLERMTGRIFTKDAGDVTRVFIIGDGLVAEPIKAITRFSIPDLSADPTTIKIDEDDDGVFTDETALAATDYILGPENNDVGPETFPFTWIELTRWGDKNSWPYKHRVEIVGKWGFPSIPSAIKQACIHITGILRLETPRASGRIEDSIIGSSVISPAANRLVADMVTAYERIRF